MKKIYALIPLAFTAFVSTSALAGQGNCTLNLVKEDGNFTSSDYDANGRATYDVTMPFTDGYYPNPWTSSQPLPRLPLRNCILYQNAPANAVVSSIRYDYTFKEAVLVADYAMLVGYLGSPNLFEYEFKRGGGFPRGSGIPLNGSRTSTLAAGKPLSSTDINLRARVTNPAVNSDCPSYIPRDQCRTKNSRLTNVVVTVNWSN